MQLFTIGFTNTTAEEFFTRLSEAGVRRIIDVRLNNRSQLAGFSKKEDLAFFARAILGADYVHLPMLAPTQDLLDSYRKQKGSWANYERSFLDLIRTREVENFLDIGLFEDACLLCSEHRPEQCHRRLVAEYLRDRWRDVEITHLG